MLAFFIWMVLLTAALLVYPRRPRTAGALIALMGVWTYLLRYLPWNNQRVNRSEERRVGKECCR